MLEGRLIMKLEYHRTLAARSMPRRPVRAAMPALPMSEYGHQPAPEVPPVVELPLSKVLELDDFPRLARWIILAFPREGRRPGFPVNWEYRKHWEVAMALNALAKTGTLRPDAEILGIAAGNEPTALVLTSYVKRVFATDLYLSPGWAESASPTMLSNPGAHFGGPWRPGRLITQHMDALDLRYEDGTFDATFSSGSIEHFGGYEKVRRAMRECYRVLKPGGICSVSTELRLAGPGPGLPGTLLFSAQELQDNVIGSAPWQVLEPALDSPGTEGETLSPVPYARTAVETLRHSRRFGLLDWDQLEWSRYPQVALHYRGRVWTSCHLALRKPDA